MKSISIFIPLFLVGLAACSTNQPANEPDDSVDYSESSSLNDVGTSPDVERDGATVSPSSNEGAVRDGAGSERAAASDTRTNSEMASPGQLTPEPVDGTRASNTAVNTTSPDNTDVNERDRSGSTKTPLDQGNNQPDLDITQAIRRAVVSNDSLSFTAKNVKIITEGGRVTLRGPVNTAEERSRIVSLAKQAAGVRSVDDQLEVKP